MAPPTSAPLNAEPASSDQRKKQHLPPKTYADAAEKEPLANNTNGFKESTGTNEANISGGANGLSHAVNGDSKSTSHKASVLRIVDTGSPEVAEKQEERPHVERQESKHEYSATVCALTTVLCNLY